MVVVVVIVLALALAVGVVVRGDGLVWLGRFSGDVVVLMMLLLLALLVRALLPLRRTWDTALLSPLIGEELVDETFRLVGRGSRLPAEASRHCLAAHEGAFAAVGAGVFNKDLASSAVAGTRCLFSYIPRPGFGLRRCLLTSAALQTSLQTETRDQPLLVLP